MQNLYLFSTYCVSHPRHCTAWLRPCNSYRALEENVRHVNKLTHKSRQRDEGSSAKWEQKKEVCTSPWGLHWIPGAGDGGNRIVTPLSAVLDLASPSHWAGWCHGAKDLSISRGQVLRVLARSPGKHHLWAQVQLEPHNPHPKLTLTHSAPLWGGGRF